MTALGLDIGGANIKAATADGKASSVPFPLWKSPEELPAALQSLIARHNGVDTLAVTMTGELADCFSTKAEGVEYILTAVHSAAAERRVLVWSTAGRFVAPPDAMADPFTVAAANWHALATWIGSCVPCRTGLLIDIGSTTTDLIPLIDGRPCPSGLTDLSRLQHQELVYTGVRRTALAAVANQVPFRGESVVVSSELFATTLDIHLLLDNIPEDLADTETANGRPATRAAAVDRLVRMLCADRTEITEAEIFSLATNWAKAQLDQIVTATHAVLQRQKDSCETVFVSGSGEFLARRVVERLPALQSARLISLGEVFTPAIAEAACAYAVACLASSNS